MRNSFLLERFLCFIEQSVHVELGLQILQAVERERFSEALSDGDMWTTGLRRSVGDEGKEDLHVAKPCFEG
jgi:hypothetical protein